MPVDIQPECMSACVSISDTSGVNSLISSLNDDHSRQRLLRSFKRRSFQNGRASALSVGGLALYRVHRITAENRLETHSPVYIYASTSKIVAFDYESHTREDFIG